MGHIINWPIRDKPTKSYKYQKLSTHYWELLSNWSKMSPYAGPDDDLLEPLG